MGIRLKRARVLMAAAAAVLVAGLTISEAGQASTSASTATVAAVSSPVPSCAEPGYAGGTLTLSCVVPPETVQVPGPAVTETSTSTATSTVTATATVTASPSPTVPATPALPAGWTRTTFYDDFTGGIDPAKWNVRHNSWAKNEESIVTNRPANVSTEDGQLALRAQRETYTAWSTTRQYTSGYLDTIGKHSQQYGRWEMRAKLPREKGLWPAFWLRENTGAGEIDIMESVGTGTGDRAQTTVQTVHQSTNGDLAKAGHEDSSVADLTAWHVYALERVPGAVRWYIDGRLVLSKTAAQLIWLDTTFNEPMNIRLNLQVGGAMPNWYGLPVDRSTQFPDGLVVDWVRVLAP